ncbi:hypothetical protein E4U54_006721, partial [Claviceps lovelessii]
MRGSSLKLLDTQNQVIWLDRAARGGEFVGLFAPEVWTRDSQSFTLNNFYSSGPMTSAWAT